MGTGRNFGMSKKRSIADIFVSRVMVDLPKNLLYHSGKRRPSLLDPAKLKIFTT